MSIKWNFNRKLGPVDLYEKVDLPKNKWHKCNTCGGKKFYYQERNLHESGGMVPCTHCDKGIMKYKWVKVKK